MTKHKQPQGVPAQDDPERQDESVAYVEDHLTGKKIPLADYPEESEDDKSSDPKDQPPGTTPDGGRDGVVPQGDDALTTQEKIDKAEKNEKAPVQRPPAKKPAK